MLSLPDSLWPHGLWPSRLLCPWDSPGRNTRVGSHALLQGIFPDQGSNPYLLHAQEDSLPFGPQEKAFCLAGPLVCQGVCLWDGAQPREPGVETNPAAWASFEPQSKVTSSRAGARLVALGAPCPVRREDTRGCLYPPSEWGAAGSQRSGLKLSGSMTLLGTRLGSQALRPAWPRRLQAGISPALTFRAGASPASRSPAPAAGPAAPRRAGAGGGV